MTLLTIFQLSDKKMYFLVKSVDFFFLCSHPKLSYALYINIIMGKYFEKIHILISKNITRYKI
jgi:hypothetical protein